MTTRTPAIFIALALTSFVAFSSCNGFSKKPKNDTASTIADAGDKPKVEDGEVVNVNGDYSMTIPKHMKSTTELLDDASLQYQNIYKELYIVVVDEPSDEFVKTFKELGEYDSKETTARNYRMARVKLMQESITMKGTPQVKKTKINGLDAEIVDFEGNAEGIVEDIYYKMAFVEGNGKLYSIMAWTMASYKEKHTDEIDGMLNSFKLQ